MEDPEGTLSFDFEGGLDSVVPLGATAGSSAILPSDLAPAPSSGSAAAAGNIGPAVSDHVSTGVNLAGRRSFRQTVCRHWLRSLCMKGEACGFLHQYDKARMPICRFFRLYGECREQDCVYKHTNEDIKECNMYKFGFCPNGPDCRYRHAKLLDLLLQWKKFFKRFNSYSIMVLQIGFFSTETLAIINRWRSLNFLKVLL
ncbi:Cleavage and polyadenylation specificity factor CPSF30 [Platanthera guangdongensis]|uniref:Cleavage and polyadenylation specificity factor CPSF30 n=1 Tax=Platanthera guangdongensis TaxID=2320717 RepID=A0ABR2MZ47_9ASPA